MQQSKNMRFFSWIVGLSFFAFVVLTTANYYFLSNSYYAHITEKNQIYTQTIALSVSSFLETAYLVSNELAQSPELQDVNAVRQQQFLIDRFSQYGFFDNLIVQRAPDGMQTSRVRGALSSRPDLWLFRQMLQEQHPFISPSFYFPNADGHTPTTVTGIFFPIMHNDTLVAVLTAVLRLDDIQERVGRYYRGDDRYTYILDEDGSVIAHPEAQQIRDHYNYKTSKKALVSRDVAGNPLFSGQDYQLEYHDIALPSGLTEAATQALNGSQGTTEYQDLDGNIMLCSYAPIHIPGYSASWATITVQNKSLAMAPLREAAATNGLLSFLIFACLAALLLRQSRAVDRGTQQLHDTNTALQAEVLERTRAEVELTATNEELIALNEQMIAITDELHHTNEQMSQEIQVRQKTEGILRLRERQYRAMVQLLTDNTATLDVQMQTMLDSALQLSDGIDGHIALLEGETSLISYVRGSHTPLLGKSLPIKEGLSALVLSTGRLHYVEDYRAFPGHIQGIIGANLSTVVVVPLKQKKQVIGCLALTWKNFIHPMGVDELEMLRQYADLACLALQAAELRENLHQELLQRKQLHDKISRIAFQDALTGLPNRVSLMSRLEEETNLIATNQQIGALFFIDLDDLKSVNDNFGHSTGDDIIIAAGQKIVEATANDNVFIARLGGDEFIVLLPKYNNVHELIHIADGLLHHLCQGYSIAETTLHLSASIGIASYPHDGTTVEELLKKADNAMYAAKAAGRNCWRFFDPVMLREAQEKSLLTNSLRYALERNELSLVYQPQISIIDGSVTGFEALLRWNSSEHGTVSPGRFIPLAEQSQLIIPIGEWVLEQACQFIKKLSLLGYPTLRVAVNLSPKQLADEHLITIVKRLLHTSQIIPRQLELEITETALLLSLDESCAKLHKLKELGVGLALDDFGTGYSSLTHLRLFPVETLKIDKSFIDNIPGEDTILVQSLINFAQNLHMNVVAEGVERQEQLDYLRTCGCNLVQGYLLSRPLPEKDALQFLDTTTGKNKVV